MASISNGPVATLIKQKLTDAFSPVHIDVINESNRHNVPPGSESHFKVVVVSDAFEAKRLIARHRLVNEVLAEELANTIHALSIHTYSEAEWQQSPEVQRTPNCKG